jgi:hypothetical protein
MNNFSFFNENPSKMDRSNKKKRAVWVDRDEKLLFQLIKKHSDVLHKTKTSGITLSMKRQVKSLSFNLKVDV